MSESPRLTVAMPTCNGSRHLREALASIRAQDRVSFDWIVSDDRSDDNTLAIVRDEVGDRARVSMNSERLGLAGNWNRCVGLSRTEWVSIFHQDDVMRPGHLADAEHLITSNDLPEIGVIAGMVEMIDDEGKPISRSVVDPGGLVIHSRGQPGEPIPGKVEFGARRWLDFLATENPLRCSSVIIRKSAHESVGGFDSSYRYAVDWDYWVRMARDWGIVWRTGPATVAMRWHLASETHRFKTGTTDLDEQVRLIDDLFRSDSPYFGDVRRFRQTADRRLARAFLNRAHVALKGGDVELARTCLGRSLELSPVVLMTMASDPRLAVQMATLRLAPQLAGRWFGR